MLARCIAVMFLLLASTSPATLHAQPSAHTPVQRYRDAKRIFASHSKDDFLHDDSPEAIDALAGIWTASTEAVIRVLSEKSEATPKDIDAGLCELLSSSGDCGEREGAQETVLSLAPHLFVVSQFSGEAGTVFVVGLRSGKPSLLWAINSERPQALDPLDLLGGWKADRAGKACRAEGSGHKPGACGPLYAHLGLLPPDAAGRPRFYIDAGCAQTVGATIGEQTSIWRWDGETARLLWIDRYAVMIDQSLRVEFADGVLTFGEKEAFRSFFACGSCEGRQLAQRLRVTPTAVEDLGKFPTTPELDLVDELFWRLANDRPTADIASAQVGRLLRPQIAAANLESKKIDPNYFTTGMLMDVSVTQSGDLERLCFTVDGDIGRLYFRMQKAPGEGAKLVNVMQPSGPYGDCPKSDPATRKQ